MKRVLLIDDDPILLRIYQSGLKKHDLYVETATDGLAAVTCLRNSRPDLVILDLMMPRFNGVDVLRFIRSHATLANLPVVLLSNSFMNELGEEAAALGAQTILPKINCSPTKLAGIIHDLLARPDEPLQSSAVLVTKPVASSPKPRPTKAAPQPTPDREPTRPLESASDPNAERDFKAKSRRDLIENAPATCALLRTLCRTIASSKVEAERSLRVEELYHKVHFLGAAASLAECFFLAQMANAFEALLFELVANPRLFSPSVARTILSTVDFLVLLFDRVQEPLACTPVSGLTLLVDDDPLSIRLIQSALARAGLKARSTQNPLEGLQWVEQQAFALILLDIEMPSMNGFEFGSRVRSMPRYHQTPIIYVTSHSDFETRAKSLFHGGDDLIAKPVFPLELAVKAVSHLLRKQLPEPAA